MFPGVILVTRTDKTNLNWEKKKLAENIITLVSEGVHSEYSRFAIIWMNLNVY